MSARNSSSAFADGMFLGQTIDDDVFNELRVGDGEGNERRTDDDRCRLRYFADLLVFLHDLLDSSLGNSIDQMSTQAKTGTEYELLGILSAYFWPSSFLLALRLVRSITELAKVTKVTWFRL